MLALLASGVGSYLFLGLTSRSLAPEAYGRMVAAWVVVRVVEPALFVPLAQVMARNLGGGRVTYDRNEFDAAMRRGWVLLAILVAAALAFRVPLRRDVVDGDAALFVVVVASLPARLAMTLAAGFSAGRSRFSTYARLMVTEAGVLAGWALLLVLLHVRSPAWYTTGLVVAPLSAIASSRTWLRLPSAEPAHDGRRGSVRSAVVHHVVASSIAVAMLGLGPVIVMVLASSSEVGEVGRLQNALSITQAPLLVLNAVFVVLLPRLSRAAAAGERRRLVRAVTTLLGVHAAVSVVAVAVGIALGPLALRISFGETYVISALRFGVLVGAAALYFGVQVTTHAFLVLGEQRRTTIAVCAGALTMTVVVALTDGLFDRVAGALLAGMAVAHATGVALLATYLFGRGHGRFVRTEFA